MNVEMKYAAIAAVAAIIAAAGTVGTLLAVTLQIQAARVDREDDYYRKLTPFLSFEATAVSSTTAMPGKAQATRRSTCMPTVAATPSMCLPRSFRPMPPAVAGRWSTRP